MNETTHGVRKIGGPLDTSEDLSPWVSGGGSTMSESSRKTYNRMK